MYSISVLFYDARSPAGFSTLPKLRAAEASEGKMKGKPQSVGAIKAGLEEQVAYTLERCVRKRFARNTYTVNNFMVVWECDLMNVQAFQNTTTIINTFYGS